MKNLHYLFIIVTVWFSATYAQHCHHNRPDLYGPIGVMGDHVHPKGTWMGSYRYMWMQMDGLLHHRDAITEDEVIHHFNYHHAPTAMIMQMHMFGIMWGASDWLNLMVMFPYHQRNMEMVEHNHATGEMESSQMETRGIGDVRVTGLISLLSKEKWTLHGQVGVSLPLGDAGIRNAQEKLLAYPMQLGSGTVDPIFNVTFRYFGSGYSLGLQGSGLLRLYSNSEGYRLGDQYTLTGWVSYNPFHWVSGTLRLLSVYEAPISPAPEMEIMPMMSPLSDADRNSERFTTRVNVGLNIQPLPYVNLGLEAQYPLYQELRGIQMAYGLMLVGGIRLLLPR